MRNIRQAKGGRHARNDGRRKRGRLVTAGILFAALTALPLSIAWSAGGASTPIDTSPVAGTLKETRAAMATRVEIERTISKERRDWQQNKELLIARRDLVKKEIATLQERIQQAKDTVAEAKKGRESLLAENQQLKDTGAKLAEAIGAKEAELRRLADQLPDPIQKKLKPLYDRMPADPAKSVASIAERFQNVLAILNELNKANSDIVVNYEVHDMPDGSKAEVQVIYVGLAQAYYLSARGEAGTLRPGPKGWQWEPGGKELSREVNATLEIIQGKQSPEFVGLPVKLQ